MPTNEERTFDQATIQTSDIPKEVIEQVKAIQKQIPKEYLIDSEDSEGWVENGLQLLHHITILFGIAEDETTLDKVKNIYKKCSPMKISFDKLDYFENKDEGYKVLVIRCESPELAELNKELSDNIENEHHKGEYKPHLTIAYMSKELEELPKLEPMTWTISNVEISKSDNTQEEISFEKKANKVNWVIKVSDIGKKQTLLETKRNLDLIIKYIQSKKIDEVISHFTDWLYLDSSNIYAFRYDNDTKVMEVQFKDRNGEPGAIYEYENVPLEEAHALNDAASHGSYFYYHIRTEFPYARID